MGFEEVYWGNGAILSRQMLPYMPYSPYAAAISVCRDLHVGVVDR